MKIWMYWAAFFGFFLLSGFACTPLEQKEAAENIEGFLPYVTGGLTAFLGPIGTAIGAVATGGIAIWKTAATSKLEKEEVDIIGSVEAGLKVLTPEQKEAVLGEISKKMDSKTKAKIRRVKAIANF